MLCPACDNELSQMEVGRVLIDVCHGHCGGVWFDNFELEKFDEKDESAGALLTITTDPNVELKPSRRRPCPRCEGIKMQRHFFSAKRKIEVDECASCGGHWLDANELARIRDEFKDAEAREDAAEEEFGQRFDGDLGKVRAETQQEVQRAQKFANMFKLICPSYWIPGKQDGAAF